MANNRIDRQVKSFKCYKKNKELILKNNKKIPGKMLRERSRPLFRLCLWIQRKINGFFVEILDDIKIPKGQPIIFAVTHIGKWDFEIVNEAISEQFFVVAADFMHLHGTIGGLFMSWNGVIYVDEEDKADKANTKNFMVKLLQSGNNIMIFPEGTWNLSENEPVYDIAYGTADVAVQTGAVIVPIAVEQYGKHFIISKGSLLDGTKYADKKSLTVILRDTFASLKWEIWEHAGVSRRAKLSDDYWERFLEARFREWPEYAMKEQIINRFIPKEKLEYWQVQKDLKTRTLPEWYELAMADIKEIEQE